MKPFLPSSETVEFVLDARGIPADAPPQLTFTSLRYGLLGRVDPEIMREAIGERVLRLLGTVARDGVMQKPGLHQLLVVNKEGTFVSVVEQGLTSRLGIVPHGKHYKNAVLKLASDLSQWIRGEPEVHASFGLRTDEKTGEIYIECPDLIVHDPFQNRTK